MTLYNSRFLVFMLAIAVTIPYHKLFFDLSLLNIFVLLNFLYLFISWRKISKLFDINSLRIIGLLNFIFIIGLFAPQWNPARDFFWSLGLFTLFLSMFSLGNSLIRFAKYYIFLIGISSVISLFQIMDFDWAWNLRISLGLPDDQVVLHQLLEQKKPAGLAYYSIQLSYQSLIAGIFILFIFPFHNPYLFIYSIILLMGLLSCGSLSTTFIFILLLTYSQFRYFKKYSILFLIILISIIFQTSVVDRVFNLDEDSGLIGRLNLNFIGLSMILDLPLFGYTLDEINNFKYESIIYYGFSDWLKDISFHNSFLTTLLENGILMLISYILIFLLIINICRKILNIYYRCGDIFGIGINNHNYNIIYFAVPAYIIKSSIHNAGIQTGDIYGWILIAFIVSMYKHANEFSKKYISVIK